MDLCWRALGSERSDRNLREGSHDIARPWGGMRRRTKPLRRQFLYRALRRPPEAFAYFEEIVDSYCPERVSTTGKVRVQRCSFWLLNISAIGKPPQAVCRSLCDRRTKSDPFSPIAMLMAFRLQLGTWGIIDESMTRRPCTPMTRSSGSTTALGSIPILQVPHG